MDTPTVVVGSGRIAVDRPELNPPARLGRAIYGLLTSVRFAVLQIVLLVSAGVVGMTIRQLPGFAFRSQADYESQMALIEARYVPALGAGVVDAMERLGLFRVFTTPWFVGVLGLLAVSIVVCTLDRTPRLWAQVRGVRVVQPEPFFDPTLSDRAAMTDLAPGAVRDVLRRHRFRVRQEAHGDVRYLYGDRHQYTKLATLITHTGLVLFLVGAAVTAAFGFEAPLEIPEGESVPVQQVGTVGNLVVKNLRFERPSLADGSAADYRSDIVVYRDGQEIAHKTIRVNDPLTIAGFSLHQNFYGPTAILRITDGTGAVLWHGPIPLDDPSQPVPYGRFVVPGREVGLELFLGRDEAGAAALRVAGRQVVGRGVDGQLIVEPAFAGPLDFGIGGTYADEATNMVITWEGVGAYSGLIARRDPGQGIVFLAAVCLLVGLVITFFFPRRRVWARVNAGGDLAIVGRSDRYVDFEAEFSALLDDLVAARGPAGSTRA